MLSAIDRLKCDLRVPFCFELDRGFSLCVRGYAFIGTCRIKPMAYTFPGFVVLFAQRRTDFRFPRPHGGGAPVQSACG